MNQWQLQEAKARLSEVVKASETEGPQEITVRGHPTAVVLSKAEYDGLRQQKLGFVEFMRKSPLAGIAIDVTRDRSTDRDLPL